MKKKNGILSWDIEEIARALKISKTDVREYFTDGRRVSFILERRIAREIFNGSIASTEGAEYDILDKKGGKWESGKLGKTTKISRKKALRLLEEM